MLNKQKRSPGRLLRFYHHSQLIIRCFLSFFFFVFSSCFFFFFFGFSILATLTHYRRYPVAFNSDLNKLAEQKRYNRVVFIAAFYKGSLPWFRNGPLFGLVCSSPFFDLVLLLYDATCFISNFLYHIGFTDQCGHNGLQVSVLLFRSQWDCAQKGIRRLKKSNKKNFAKSNMRIETWVYADSLSISSI